MQNLSKVLRFFSWYKNIGDVGFGQMSFIIDHLSSLLTSVDHKYWPMINRRTCLRVVETLNKHFICTIYRNEKKKAYICFLLNVIFARTKIIKMHCTHKPWVCLVPFNSGWFYFMAKIDGAQHCNQMWNI